MKARRVKDVQRQASALMSIYENRHFEYKDKGADRIHKELVGYSEVLKELINKLNLTQDFEIPNELNVDHCIDLKNLMSITDTINSMEVNSYTKL